MNFFDSIILGIVEGITEFLPVSSTGHLILSAQLLGLKQTDTMKCFEVAIQLGAILSVVFLYFNRLTQDIKLWTKLITGFIPTAIIGLILYKHIKDLFNPEVVAYMLIFWGIIFIIIELFHKKLPNKDTVTDLNKVTYWQSFLIGLSQCLAMIPGTSRSGSTIIVGLLCGLNREVSAQFSFLLAIPTMIAATVYDVYKNRALFIEASDDIWLFTVGFIVSFIVSFLAIKWFLNFIKKFNYTPFGIYRIIAGIAFLLFATY